MKRYFSTLLLLASATGVGYGQAEPTATATPSPGWSSPMSWNDGTIHYSLTASELLQFGYYGEGTVTPGTSFSGNVAYSNNIEKRPFSMIYSGGVIFQNQSGYGTQFFQSLSVAQGLNWRRWNMGITDSVSYSPQTLTTGLSGIPGVGDIGTSTPPTQPSSDAGGGVLTYGQKQVNNSLGGQIGRSLTGRTSISGSASWWKLFFLDGQGLDSDGISSQIGLNHTIDLRDTVGVSVLYSTYTTQANSALAYPKTNFQTKGINVSFSRLLTKTMSFSASAGPMWINGSGGQVIPSTLNYSANANLGYNRKLSSMGVLYSHGVNGGSGVQAGALADSLGGYFGRPLTEAWRASINAGFTKSTSLLAVNPIAVQPIPGTVNENTKTFYVSTQVSRALGRSWSCYASYTAQKQSVDSIYVGQNAFNGFSQTVGFGVTFAPKARRLGEF